MRDDGPNAAAGSADPAPDAGAPAREVHRPAAHDSAAKHAAGGALYIDDLPEPPGLLHVQLGFAGAARARVAALDLAAVRAAPGVVAVFAAEDVPGVNDVSPVKGDEPMFAEGEVLFEGQPLFAVAAESRRAARAAARLARSEAVARLEALPAVVTLDDALAAGEEMLLEPPFTIARGDAAAALAAAPRRLEGRLDIGGQEHFYLEAQAALAIPGEDGDLLVHSSTQHPSEIQHKVADMLGVPFHAVTVEVRRMGGGFGGKESQGNLPACAAALAAAKTGRPAKCVYDRDDDMVVTGKRHDARIAYRVGFDETGRILGLEVDQEIRCGWSWDLSEPVADRAMFHADNCYHLPAARIRSRRWRTHTCSNTAFRGFGGPQGMLGAEKVVEDVARALGRDPLEVRRRNFYPSAAAVAAAPEPPEAARTPYGMLVEDCVIQEIVDALTESAGYARRRDEIAAWNAAEPVLKRGLAIAPVKFGISFTKSFMNQAGALVHVYSDGSVQLNHGGAEMGQGLFVKVAQVTADAFGLPLSAVKITATTTGKVPNTAPTAASSGTDLNGMAAQRAALAIRARMAARFAEEAGCAPEAVRFEEGRVRGGSLEMRFGALARACHLARVSLSSTGFYATPKISWDKASGTGRPFFYFAYGAAVVEAAVDALTGEHRLLAADILHDCGRSLNPAIDIGQIEGGFVQGVGWLTTEELAWDREGRLRTHSPSTYKIPTAADRPRRMRIRLWERGENREETIYRSKAVGEPPLMLANAAFFAIADAVAACAPERGATTPSPLHAPATPERVLAAIAALRGGG